MIGQLGFLFSIQIIDLDIIHIHGEISSHRETIFQVHYAITNRDSTVVLAGWLSANPGNFAGLGIDPKFCGVRWFRRNFLRRTSQDQDAIRGTGAIGPDEN